MKPLRIFIFFASTALCLFLLSLVIPGEGISLSPSVHLKFMKLSDLRRSPQNSDEVVKQLMAASSVSEDPEAGISEPLPEPADSISLPCVTPANADSLKKTVPRISFSEKGSDLLHPFFSRLDGLLDGSVARTRIMHFGDSQLENDRMTALIRYRLQRRFGGTGTGLVQAMPLYGGSMAYRQEEEGDWLRHTFFGSRDSTIIHKVFGIMGAFASVPVPEKEEWPRLDYEFNTARRTGTFDRTRVFIHSYAQNAGIDFVVNDTLTDTIRNIPDGFSTIDYRHHSQITSLSLSMNMPEGGRIYGISFESYRGLQVDNIAMRGGSGLIFTKMNREQQMKMMEYLSPGLIILQFGGNVVPYINAARYQLSFKRELDFLKVLCPGIPVIVIGPADMSIKEKGVFVSYPGLEPVRDALRNAAFESGFAFWDLYEAMGGYNSMPSFVNADPALASTDYIHFTALGVNLVAEMFYTALMLEYQHYQSQNR